MLAALLRGTDWSRIADYLSPVLFQVVPPLAMAKQVQTLLKSYRDKDAFENLKSHLGERIASAGWGIQLDGYKDYPTTLPVTEMGVGDYLLRLYFWQILAEPTAILDLRSKGWQIPEKGKHVWNPAPLYVSWDPEFIAAIRDMYRGFYQGDEARLDRGLEKVGLKPGKKALLAHFGQSQDVVSFDLAHFRSSFHDIFLACKESRSRLHPNVLGLGAALACLYEHLGELGQAFNVRQAFLDAEELALTTPLSHGESCYAT